MIYLVLYIIYIYIYMLPLINACLFALYAALNSFSLKPPDDFTAFIMLQKPHG
ncbi:hypothetical protein Hanom_Chr10g00918031 [Helianthus anomalus]